MCLDASSPITPKVKMYIKKVYIFSFFLLQLLLAHNELKTRGKKVHFGRTMQCLPQRLKSSFFEIFSSGEFPKSGAGVKIFFLKTVDFSL